MTDAAPTETRALIRPSVCYTAWGVFPLLFMAMAHSGFTAPEILAHRALWALLFAGPPWCWPTGRMAGPAGLATPATMGWLLLSTVMIADQLGRSTSGPRPTITPSRPASATTSTRCSTWSAGLFLFREKIDKWGWVAIGSAAVGVVLQALALGRAPWMSIADRRELRGYGVIRKRVAADAQTGLFVECLLMIPFGAGLLIWAAAMPDRWSVSTVPGHWAWSISSGLATVLPLALFAWSARRLPLSTIGFLQFLAPTLQFAIGVASGEPLTGLRIASFAFIWAGAAVFAGAALWARAERQAIKTTFWPTGRRAEARRPSLRP
jgi:chloramphenicol-sensitive protein RarD